jgi:hypothetical protein
VNVALEIVANATFKFAIDEELILPVARLNRLETYKFEVVEFVPVEFVKSRFVVLAVPVAYMSVVYNFSNCIVDPVAFEKIKLVNATVTAFRTDAKKLVEVASLRVALPLRMSV